MSYLPSRSRTPAKVGPVNDGWTVRLDKFIKVTATKMRSAVMRHVRPMMVTEDVKVSVSTSLGIRIQDLH